MIDLGRRVHDRLPARHFLVLDLGLEACGVVLDQNAEQYCLSVKGESWKYNINERSDNL
jgi:hypothetical protein